MASRPEIRILHVGDGLDLSMDPSAPIWQGASVGRIDRFPWNGEGFRPTTDFRAVWQSDAVSVLFQVQDRYVRCVETNPGGKVWEDACVEFFFSPGHGYFNVEANCGGTLLVAWQTGRNENRRAMPADAIRHIEVLSSCPQTIDPEIAEPYAWSLAFRLPFALLQDLAHFEPPDGSTFWSGNFYKCAEACSNPHWGSWSLIDSAKPDFHRPECFGALQF